MVSDNQKMAEIKIANNCGKIEENNLLARRLELLMRKLKLTPELADFSPNNLTYSESGEGDVAIIIYNNNPKTTIDSATLIVIEAIISWIADWKIIWHPQLNFQSHDSSEMEQTPDRVESVFLLIFKHEYQKLQRHLEQYFGYNQNGKN